MAVSQSTIRDFKAAYLALRDARPTKSVLKAKYSTKGVSIRIADVAAEAGHSRRLLYQCADVLKEIAVYNAELRQPRRSTDIIANLRAANRQLREDLNRALSNLAAMQRYCRSLEEGKVSRLKVGQ